ncbi:MAG: rod shape-determining protein MreD [bacterium]|nr:rod shape-determining protein MreD [bacterium]
MIKDAYSAFILTLPLLGLGLLVESTLPTGWPRPELAVLFLCIIALRYGATAGMCFGFLAGCLTGFWGACSWGTMAFAYSVLGVVIGQFLSVYNDRPFIYVLTVIFASMFFMAELTVGGMLHMNVPPARIVREELLGMLLGNLVLVWPLLAVVNKLLGAHAFIPLPLECEE